MWKALCLGILVVGHCGVPVTLHCTACHFLAACKVGIVACQFVTPVLLVHLVVVVGLDLGLPRCALLHRSP